MHPTLPGYLRSSSYYEGVRAFLGSGRGEHAGTVFRLELGLVCTISAGFGSVDSLALSVHEWVDDGLFRGSLASVPQLIMLEPVGVVILTVRADCQPFSVPVGVDCR